MTKNILENKIQMEKKTARVVKKKRRNGRRGRRGRRRTTYINRKRAIAKRYLFLILFSFFGAKQLEIVKTTILGNSGLGLYGFATDTYSLVPFGVKEELKDEMNKTLNVLPVETTISGSVLIGVLSCGNSKTLLVPYNIRQKELDTLKSALDPEIEIIEVKSKYTALGNLILINDKGVLVSNKFEKEAINQLKDSLSIEVEVGEILNSPLVGTMAMCTNKGALTHPLTSEEEKEALRSLLGVRIDLCTVNRGVPYPRVGIIANSKGALIGKDTTGPESMRIFEVLLS